MGRTSEKVFCAFCKIPRRAYTKKHLSGTNVLLGLLGAALLTYGIWGSFDGRFFVLWVFGLAIAEAFIQYRWRVSSNCPHCGFDPVLYLKDQSASAHKVKQHLDERKTSPQFLLSSNNPFLNLPTIKAEKRPLLEEATKMAKEDAPFVPNNENGQSRENSL